jgi:NhaP-type Na+/H+ or K+/H+ antiporter
MSAASRAAGSGVVLGIIAVLLAQQFGYIELSNIGPTVLYLVVGAIVGGVVFGLLGWILGRRYQSAVADLNPTPAE